MSENYNLTPCFDAAANKSKVFSLFKVLIQIYFLEFFCPLLFTARFHEYLLIF